MWRTSLIFALGCLLSATSRADDVGRAVVEKAIKAHGGPDKVAKFRIMRVKAEGTISPGPGQPAIQFVIEDWWQMPDQYKTTSRYELGGKEVSQTQIIDGNTGWVQFDGMVRDMPKEAVAEMREQKYAEDLRGSGPACIPGGQRRRNYGRRGRRRSGVGRRRGCSSSPRATVT